MNSLEKRSTDAEVSYCSYGGVGCCAPTVRRTVAPASDILNNQGVPKRYQPFGVSPEASVTTAPLTGAEQARLRQRFLVRVLLAACLLLGGVCAGWTLYQEKKAGASLAILAGIALLGLFSLRCLPNQLRQCRLARADYQAGIKRVIRGPLLASDRISSARQGGLPRFRWLIGDTLIGIDVNWDFFYIRGLDGRRLRPGDCEAMQRPGRMLEAHLTAASGMALYVASTA
ncbi:hypothetical protein [Dyella sp. GSA-30]|uniref:hypothetical protein n=1 Tax=Dyella sp. GSA-30 TaxID=2994496 RepID=UPI00248F8335|nr:hypothetical protein [Dyella sp. GSA-30]